MAATAVVVEKAQAREGVTKDEIVPTKLACHSSDSDSSSGSDSNSGSNSDSHKKKSSKTHGEKENEKKKKKQLNAKGKNNKFVKKRGEIIVNVNQDGIECKSTNSDSDTDSKSNSSNDDGDKSSDKLKEIDNKILKKSAEEKIDQEKNKDEDTEEKIFLDPIKEIGEEEEKIKEIKQGVKATPFTSEVDKSKEAAKEKSFFKKMKELFIGHRNT
ncbi:uncharacterized protein [Typha latifolia]|uniref:uncharacterized protein n=1 Tax=Typha latifolia TaxID=4733 RepID=UPI003C2C8F50